MAWNRGPLPAAGVPPLFWSRSEYSTLGRPHFGHGVKTLHNFAARLKEIKGKISWPTEG